MVLRSKGGRVSTFLNSALRYRVEKWIWIIFIPIAFVLGWVNQVAVVSLLSIYALVISAAAAEQAAEAKEKQDG